ncbi:hypothetical protein LA080_012312 [Diaporthe eres]|nr:hypothetical protein LA080_012312 [Diaporthe eres]
MERMSKKLVLSGRLKPEARLGLEISRFAQSLDDERRKEFRRMQTAKGSQISGWDVIKVTEEINQEGARHHSGFLSRIQTLASIGDVLIGGSQNLIATGVWSAVRLSLTIATNYMNYFEKLSTLFMRLGTSWALHEDFAQLFPRSEILQAYFCEYLIVLMKLCNKVVVFGRKNIGAQLFSSIGSSFDSEFGTIQKELDQWGCLIQQQSQLLAMKIATGAENSRFYDLKQRTLRRLSPHQQDFETRWRRQRKKGTCEWIFNTPSFTDWKFMQTSGTLCISEAIAWREAEQFDAMISVFDPESIVNLVLALLPMDRTYIIIVDGLEDCFDADITDLVAKQHFEPEFSISHDDVNHDAELESYIVKEVATRNTTRHLSPELEELVMKQLILGAQGMYLWASLQLDSIFPANSKVVITDDHILNLITHLPKDLPEAFERALEGIPDHQYEGKIMKLVLSAATPLDLDEIRVALCVVPGERVWYPEKIAKDGSQLISLCGGNLLELDEEDGKVRFIHHSVIQHLLSPAGSERTTPYHFTAEAAENYIGATCVTYLHLPVLDSRITITRNIQSVGVLDSVIGTTQESLPGVSRLVQHIKSREQKRGRPSRFDIGHVLSQIQAVRLQQDIDPRCFELYATSHWMFHTKFFDEKIQYCKDSWRLWWQLLNGGMATVKPPWADLEEKSYPALVWAVNHGHGSLFRNILAKGDLLRYQTAEIVAALKMQDSIRGHWLGDILAQYLHSLHTIDMRYAIENIKYLLEAGADPTAPHSKLKSSSMEILIHSIFINDLSADLVRQLIRDIFCHPSVQAALGDDSVVGVLRKLLENKKSVAIGEILVCRPDLRFEFHQIGKGRPSGRSAIEKALDSERWEEVEYLATQGRVNTPTFAGTSLLWRAIETKSDAWVFHLLRLGADPNIGPFEMTHPMDSPSFVAKCYPLEAALWLRRTRVCLELLRHEAKIDRLGGSAFQIARKTGNCIVSARLHEITDWLERKKQPNHQRTCVHDRTALAIACEMLSRGILVEPPGFPRPIYVFELAGDWKSKLEKIIYRLTLDEDAEYVNTQDADGKAALHYLLGTKDIYPERSKILVNVLLSRGADPNIPDCRGETPLWLAIRNTASVDAVIQPLLDAGADLNRGCLSQNFSPIKEAMIAYSNTTSYDFRTMVKLLLEFGADPRDPEALSSADPALVSLARANGMEGLVNDFIQPTIELNFDGA